MKTNLIKAGACAGLALAVAVIGWTPGSSGGGRANGATGGPPSVVLRLPAQGIGLNGGKDIRVRVTVTCANAVAAPITVRIRQARNSRTIAGVGTSNQDYRCNGRSHVVPVLVHANRGFFIPGPANASANVRVCSLSGSPCDNGSDSRAIDLVPPTTSTSTGG